MKQILLEYNVGQDVMNLFCDNMSAINISNNPVQHGKTKHIDIRHHFIRDIVKGKIVKIDYIWTDRQIDDIFTKTLDVSQFKSLRSAFRSLHYGFIVIKVSSFV